MVKNRNKTKDEISMGNLGQFDVLGCRINRVKFISRTRQLAWVETDNQLCTDEFEIDTLTAKQFKSGEPVTVILARVGSSYELVRIWY